MMWAVENIVAKKLLADVSPDVVVGARMGMGSLILMGIMVASGKAPLVLELSSQQWWMLGGVGVLLFGYVMTWYRALKLAPATQVASVLVGASVITTLLNAVFMTHAIKGELVLQMGVIVTGIWLVVMAAMDGWKTNAPLRHARA
jgi:drug/metabolite transporter (DMT)-like permease